MQSGRRCRASLVRGRVQSPPGGTQSAAGGQWFSFLPAMRIGGRSWRPVVQFTAAGGRMVEFRSKFGTQVRYDPGEPVPICYGASNPGVAMIDTFSQAWLIPASLILLGLVVLVTAAT